MLILITGPAGSGKSTAAKRIASLVPRGIAQIMDECPDTWEGFRAKALGEVVIITCQVPAQWAIEYPDVVHICTPAATEFWKTQWDVAGKTSQLSTGNQ